MPMFSDFPLNFVYTFADTLKLWVGQADKGRAADNEGFR